ncbi:MAG: two-component system, chemotaxis family, protein-glutamate methylesterase/glutaminase [Blastocatellia bacterium]
MNYDLIVAGASLGGYDALALLLGALPENFHLPLAVVQHRSVDSDELLSTLLRRACRLPIVEVEDKQPILPGTVFIAPANYHLLVEKDHFALSVDERVQFSRPSIDVLFESAADAYRDKVVAILLSGSNEDGAQGIARVKARGGLTIVQDPASAESARMPAAAIAGAEVDHVLPLAEIAQFLNDLVHSSEDYLWHGRSRQMH